MIKIILNKYFFSFTGDLLENYCWYDDLMNVSRVAFSISILLTFPIECFVAREVIVLWYCLLYKKNEKKEKILTYEKGSRKGLSRFVYYLNKWMYNDNLSVFNFEHFFSVRYVSGKFSMLDCYKDSTNDKSLNPLSI